MCRLSGIFTRAIASIASTPCTKKNHYDLGKLMSGFKQTPGLYSVPGIFRPPSPVMKYNSLEEMLEDLRKKEAKMKQENKGLFLHNLRGPERAITALNVSLIYCIERKQYEVAEKLFQTVRAELGIVPDKSSHDIMIKGFCTEGTKVSFNKAILLLDEMEDKGMVVEMDTFFLILSGLYQKGWFSDGEKVYQRMEKRRIECGRMNYYARIDRLVDEGMVSHAQKLAEEMKAKNIEMDATCYNAFLRGYSKDGKLDEAKRVYGDMLKSGCEPDPFTYECFLPLLCEKGDWDFALHLTTKCINSDSCYHFFMIYELVQSVVNVLVKHSKVDEAKKLVELGNSKDHCQHRKLKLPSKDN